MKTYRMKLGVASGWSSWQPGRSREHTPYDYELNLRWAHKPYERFRDRIESRRRYRSGPRPWSPGRYRTAAWGPYHGFGRFSELPTIMRGKYYAARYTGEHITPEHYILRNGGRAEYEKSLADTWRRTSWRMM